MTNEDELFLLLGKTVFESCHLEHAIGVLTAQLTGKPWDGPVKGAAVGTNIADSKKLASAAGCKILDECEEAFDRRHQYVHGAWLLNDTEEGPSIFTFRTGRKGGPDKLERVSAEDLMDLAATLRRLTEEVSSQIRQIAG
ncbi:hypothetical protein [Streptomyces xanthophaeus]|uniref:Uncharacterized protein n=1 Tax=Streptomyces xanthophaeus TaxID=67385 RepID=A0A919GT32_9ACTN|nr:hypothetical protein [Streptomyces xanthophaeus]GHI84118.1 hypothetical protein Sxan_14820 [Streptomyces xanthophaeus]